MIFLAGWYRNLISKDMEGSKKINLKFFVILLLLLIDAMYYLKLLVAQTDGDSN